MIGYLKLYPCVQVHARGKFYYNPHAFLVHITQKNQVQFRQRYRYLAPDLPVSCAFFSISGIRTHMCTQRSEELLGRKILHGLFLKQKRVHQQSFKLSCRQNAHSPPFVLCCSLCKMQIEQVSSLIRTHFLHCFTVHSPFRLRPHHIYPVS